jgi:hypothetical protein
MDVTTVLAVILSGIVFLSWFVLPAKGSSARVADVPESLNPRGAAPEALAV